MLIHQNPEIEHSVDGPTHVLFNPGTGVEIELNEAANEVWSLTKTCHSLNEIFQTIADRNRLDTSHVEADYSGLVFFLIQSGFLVTDRNAVFLPYLRWCQESGALLYFPSKRLSVFANDAFADALGNASALNLETLDANLVDDDFKRLAENLLILNEPCVERVNPCDSFSIPKRVVLLPTTACNLSCKYCYAADPSKPKQLMTLASARGAIDYVVANSFRLGNPKVALSFMGGGEPTTNWHVLKGAVEYAQKEAQRLSLPLSITLTTNGVFTKEHALWIAKNIDFVKVSFDGVREVQENQRPFPGGSSFDAATQTLRVLSESGVDFLVRMTVTNESLNLMEESIRFVLANFTPTSIILNPVYVCGACTNEGVESIERASFCRLFEHVQDLGMDKGVDIVTPYDKLTYAPKAHTPYCGFVNGNCFVTPDGFLSACSEIDSGCDPRSAVFFFGRIDQSTGVVQVDQKKLSQIHEISAMPGARCGSCSSGGICPGPCLVRRLSAETIERLTFLRRGVDPVRPLTQEEVELILIGSPSHQSDIQCGITNALSKIQVLRSIERLPDSTNLAVRAEEVVTSKGLTAGPYRIHKAVQLSLGH